MEQGKLHNQFLRRRILTSTRPLVSDVLFVSTVVEDGAR